MALPLEVAFSWQGQDWVARGDRSLWWPSRETLFVADLHLGKGTSYRKQGVPVPSGTTATTLAGLTLALQRSSTRHLVILGDLWHDRAARSPECLAAWSGWLAQHANLEVTLVIGNHDRRAGPFAGGGLSEVAEGWAIGPIACHHHPQEPGGIPSLAGHLHPTIRLVERCPCFWVQPDQIILPAFGAFTGGSFIEPRKGDEVIGIVEGQVFRQSNFHNNDYRNDNRAR